MQHFSIGTIPLTSLFAEKVIDNVSILKEQTIVDGQSNGTEPKADHILENIRRASVNSTMMQSDRNANLSLN